MPKAKAGTLKEKVDRTKKKLAAGGEKLTPERARTLRKRIKRSQRARRSILAAEARMKAKAAKGKKEETTPATS